MPNSALKRSAKLVSFCPNSLVPTGTWTTKKMNTTQPYCLGQVAFALCSDQGDIATFSIYSCVSRFQPSEVFGKMVTGKRETQLYFIQQIQYFGSILSVSGERHGWSYLQWDETCALRFAPATDDFLVGIMLIIMKKQAKGKETDCAGK